jgi:ribonuclease R
MAPLHQPPDVQARLLAILAEHDLSIEHRPELEAAAADLAADPGLDDPTLEDLERLPFVTIDYEHSKDLDQALHIEREGTGASAGWRLRYALADASYYLRPGSALFTEALRRGASYYLAHLCAPMLPTSLCEGIISLNPGVVRRALVLELPIDAEGRPGPLAVRRARIRSRAKLSYDGVQAWVDDPTHSPLDGREFSAVLAALRELGGPLLAQARARGMIPFERPEVAWEPPGPTAPGFRLVAEQRNDVERWNEQISLLCNTEAARLMQAHPDPELQPIYRVHPHPLADRLDSLDEHIRNLCDLHGLPEGPWTWRRGRETLADYVARLPRGPREDRLRQAIQRWILHSYERSDFTPEPGPHHALGVPCYGRFTAPMREIVGVFAHKELLELMGLEAPGPRALDERLREQVLQAADRAREVQRTVTREGERLALDFLLDRDGGQTAAQRPHHTGTVLGLSRTRLYVRLDDPPLELKVYGAHLERAYGRRFVIDEHELTLGPEGGGQPRFRVGDPITLVADGRDAMRDRWRLLPIPTQSTSE